LTNCFSLSLSLPLSAVFDNAKTIPKRLQIDFPLLFNKSDYKGMKETHV